MTHKKRQFTFFIVFPMLLLTGCQPGSFQTPSGEPQETERVEASPMTEASYSEASAAQPAEIVDFPENYTDTENELVQFQAVVKAPEGMPEEIYTDITVTYVCFDFDKALEGLLPPQIDRDSLTKEIIPDIDEAFPQSVAYNDQIELSNSYYTFDLLTDKWKRLRYAIFTESVSPQYNMPVYEKRREFSFGTAEEVFEDLEKTMRTLGLHTELQCTAYYADSETLQEQYVPMEQKAADGGQVSFEEKDSGYYFSAVQVVEKLPVYACLYYGSGVEGGIEAANLLAYIDGDGLEMLRAERVIDTISYGEQKGRLLSLETIADVVKNRFGMIITDNKVEVKEMRLCYMTQPINQEELRLLPVWQCNYEVTDQDGNCSQEQILMNAVTGEEVMYVI